MKPQYILQAFLMTGLLFLLFLPAQGQITITKTDILNATSIGTTGTGYITPYGTNPVVHIGPTSSAPQTWNFRNFTFEEFNTISFIAPTAAPHIASFPQTNVVLKQYDADTKTSVYQYGRITDTEYLILGTGNDSDTTLITYNPPMPQMNIPLTLGKSWTYIGLPKSPYPGVTVQNSCTYTVDATGIVQLVQGEFPALRLRAEYITDTKTASYSALTRGLAYHFF